MWLNFFLRYGLVVAFYLAGSAISTSFLSGWMSSSISTLVLALILRPTTSPPKDE